MAFYKHVRASANGLKTNNVIEDWRHWLRYVAACRRGRAAYTIYSIWEIPAAVYFQVTAYYIRHGNSVLASVYSICKQSVVQGVAYNDLMYCCGWKASKNGNFDTQAADIRRIFRISTNLGELT